MVNFKFTNEEILFLKSKKIVRNNLLKYNIDLVNKIDKFSEINNISFSESVYIICNNFKIPKCANCEKNKTSFLSNKKGYKKYCSTKCSNSHVDTKNNKINSYLEKYGVENPSFLDEVKNRISGYMKNQSLETKLKRKETMIFKYGYESNILRPNIIDNRNEKLSYQVTKDKRKETCLEKYGVDNYTKTDEYRKKIAEKYKNKIIETTLNRDENYINHLGDGQYELKCDSKDHTFFIHRHLYHARKRISVPLCTICYPINELKSIKEKELYGFIKSVYNGYIIDSYRDGFEIDIYLPDLNLGFEFNGVYWHSELFKDKWYHLDKTNYFKERGIRIIHIWEDDWIYKKDIIKSQILNWLGLTPTKVFARKCEVKEVSGKKLVRDFLDKNHIQGNISSSLKIGLFYNGDLVSLMTFDHFEGRNKMLDSEWNISRFCNKIGINVLGGASKILKYFINNWKPSRIISFADKEWSTGDLYFKLNFNLKYESPPNYKYVVCDKRVNKQRYTKKKLIDMGFDPILSESQIMKNLKNYKVFDCGQIKFELLI
jgi:hypothetical protein